MPALRQPPDFPHRAETRFMMRQFSLLVQYASPAETPGHCRQSDPLRQAVLLSPSAVWSCPLIDPVPSTLALPVAAVVYVLSYVEVATVVSLRSAAETSVGVPPENCTAPEDISYRLEGSQNDGGASC